MKVTSIIASLLFIGGLIFKICHWPWANLMLFMSTVILVLLSLGYCIVKIKRKPIKAIFPLAFSSWLAYFLFRIFYWQAGGYIFGMATIFIIPLAISIIYFILLIKNKRFQWRDGLLLLVLIFSFVLGRTHSYEIYYIFNKSQLNPEIKNCNGFSYTAWDHYSWFLYIANDHKAALSANMEAEKAWDRCKSSEEYAIDTNYIVKIKDHRLKISTATWENFND